MRSSELARFALSLATCLSSGLPTTKAIALSIETTASWKLRAAQSEILSSCERGQSLSEALEVCESEFPGFFFPILHAGEISGRTIEALQLVNDYCNRLEPTLQLLRKAWLYPAICTVAGWIVRIGLLLFFGLGQAAWQLTEATFISMAITILIIRLLLSIPIFKEGVDWLFLHIPGVRTLQIRLGKLLFFTTFRLVYEAGGVGVSQMLEISLNAIRNRVLRRDFRSIQESLVRGEPFEEAFQSPRFLDEEAKSVISTGALSGHLGLTAGQIANSTALELEISLELLNRILHRLVALGVGLSIAGTILVCLSSLPAQ